MSRHTRPARTARAGREAAAVATEMDRRGSRGMLVLAALALVSLSGAGTGEAPGLAPAAPPAAGVDPEEAGRQPAQPAAAEGIREVFPGVRVNLKARWVEFDGTVPVAVRAAKTPAGREPAGSETSSSSDREPGQPAPTSTAPVATDPGAAADDARTAGQNALPERKVYLEVIACTADTKEHEALIVTTAKPAHIHAALLLLGLEPGEPGRWEQEGVTPGKLRYVEPRGPKMDVSFLLAVPAELPNEDQSPREGGASTTKQPTQETRQAGPDESAPRLVDPLTWVVDHQTGTTLRKLHPEAAWVFAGSRLTPSTNPNAPGEVYRADVDGTIVGLSTFGSETLALTVPLNPEAAAEEPRWIAGPATPARGTKIVVRISVPSDSR